jgi:hypothetical protein
MSSQWVDFAAIKESVAIKEGLSPWSVSTADTRLGTEPGELWRGHQQGRVGLSFGFLLSGTPRKSGWEYS